MSEIKIERDNTQILIWGWAAVIGLGAIGIAALILSAAIAQAILILAGCGGAGMVILSVGRAVAWYRLADAQAKQAEAELTEAKTRHIQVRNSHSITGGRYGS